MSWWGQPTAGYSSGPLRVVELDHPEATALFARARSPDLGKPLPGKDVRLWKKRDGSFRVTYRDTPVVDIHPDDTYTLMHGGYPTKMTAQRINEYAPAEVSTHGVRRRESHEEGFEFYMWDNLEIAWKTPPAASVRRKNLLMQLYPDQFEQSEWRMMPFPRDQIRVDSDGEPVLVDLLSEIAPDSWSYAAGSRLQAWARPLPDTTTGRPIEPRELGLRPADWEQAAQELPVLVRRSWFNTPAGLVWWVRPLDGPDHYRWAAKNRPSTRLLSGTSRNLEGALQQTDQALLELGWESGSPRLAALLGPLSSQLGRTPDPDPVQPLLPLPLNERLLGMNVKRVHWMEPWTTVRVEAVPGVSVYDRPRTTLPREPLPGSQLWPGPTDRQTDVRLWFEVNGHGVALSSVKGTDRVLVHSLGAELQTEWQIDEVLATGLVAAVLAWLTGQIG